MPLHHVFDSCLQTAFRASLPTNLKQSLGGLKFNYADYTLAIQSFMIFLLNCIHSNWTLYWFCNYVGQWPSLIYKSTQVIIWLRFKGTIVCNASRFKTREHLALNMLMSCIFHHVSPLVRANGRGVQLFHFSPPPTQHILDKTDWKAVG